MLVKIGDEVEINWFSWVRYFLLMRQKTQAMQRIGEAS